MLIKLKEKALWFLSNAEVLIYLIIIINATIWGFKYLGWKWAIAIHLLIDLIYCIIKLYANPGLYYHLVDLGRQARKKWDEGKYQQ